MGREARPALVVVPHLDDVALGILDVERSVPAVVLLRAADLRAVAPETPGQLVEAARAGGEGEVHVAPALVAELLLARGPQAEPGAGAGREPDPVVPMVEDLEAEGLRVEAAHHVEVVR